MGFQDLLIVQGINGIGEEIDEIEGPLLKGLAIIVVLIAGLWIVGYFLGFQAFNGHWKRSVIILGVLLFLEIAYFVGGGHNPKNYP